MRALQDEEVPEGVWRSSWKLKFDSGQSLLLIVTDESETAFSASLCEDQSSHMRESATRFWQPREPVAV